MTKRLRKKRATLERATPAYAPGGSMAIIPANMLQSIYNQTFYGNTGNNPAVAKSTALFSPGVPLPTQEGVNPGGFPIQWKFMPSYNTFPVDRSMGNSDIPSFEQLRRLAKLYSGITLCERGWFDMVPRMKLKIELKPEYIADGADEQDYQEEMKYFLNWFERPDAFHEKDGTPRGGHDMHTWLRMLLREQTQIDELYLYKHKTRGGRLLSLKVIAGDQMKPLLDNWGAAPIPPEFAYQQFPWGLPGMQYTSDMLVHYQESPAADSPYGMSRVERIIMEVNQALRKKKKDLAKFTEGNIPAGIMKVPEGSNWTADQIDTYEQLWNALLTGSAQQQSRIKFTQPGFEYEPFDQPEDSLHLTEFDQFLMNIAVGMYGMSMGDIAFTGDIHKSSGDSQQNVLYRRTIDPLAMVYASIITHSINHDFEPQHKGEMFQATYGGFDEEEDLGTTVTAYSDAVQNGLIGLSDASKALKFPIPTDGKYIGRVLITKTGPMFLDDKEVMDAQRTAQLAGFKMAANPPEPGGPGQPGGGKSPAASGDDDGLDEAEDAADTATKSLSRYDQVHAWHGEFGFSNTPAPTPKTGRRKGVRHKSKHKKGPHLSLTQRTRLRMQKFAARFEKLENRKLGKHWSAAQAAAAGRLEGIFSHLATALGTPGQQATVDHLFNQAWAQAKIVFAGKASGLRAMSNALTKIDDANDKGLFRVVDTPIFEDPIEDSSNEEEDDEAEYDDLEDELDDLEEESEEISDPLTQSGEEGQARRGNGPEDGQYLQAGESTHGDHSLQSTATPSYRTAAIDSGTSSEYRRWRGRAVEDMRMGRTQRGFTSTVIPEPVHRWISQELAQAESVDAVRAVFERARDETTLEGVA